MTDETSKISLRVAEQLPSFVAKDYPLFITFMEAYYEWLEQVSEDGTMNPGAAILSLDQTFDIDRSADQFLQWFRDVYLYNVPANAFNGNRDFTYNFLVDIDTNRALTLDCVCEAPTIKKLITPGLEERVDFFDIAAIRTMKWFVHVRNLLNNQSESYQVMSTVGSGAEPAFTVYSNIGSTINHVPTVRYDGTNIVLFIKNNSGDGTIRASVVRAPTFLESEVLGPRRRYTITTPVTTSTKITVLVGRDENSLVPLRDNQWTLGPLLNYCGDQARELVIDDDVELDVGWVVQIKVEDTAAVNERLLMKIIGDINRTKGTEAAVRLLFRLLYNEEIKIEYPSQRIIIASDGRWDAANATINNDGTWTKNDGKYLAVNGFLSDYPLIQDSLVTNVYTYLIHSNHTLDEYRRILVDMVHPAGVGVFGNVTVSNCLTVFRSILDEFKNRAVFSVDIAPRVVDAFNDTTALGPRFRTLDSYKFNYENWYDRGADLYSALDDTPVNGNTQITHFEDWTLAPFEDTPDKGHDVLPDADVQFELLPPPPPIARFRVTPSQTGYAPLALTFDASTTETFGAPIVSYAWNFGDMTTGTGLSVSHTFASVGTYTVTLTVTDSIGQVDTKTKTILVKALQPLVAEFDNSSTVFDLNINPPLTVTFDASGTTKDPNFNITGYQWDFGDGNTVSTNNPIVSHTYSTTGNYAVTLTVTDAFPRSDDFVKNIEVVLVRKWSPAELFPANSTGDFFDGKDPAGMFTDALATARVRTDVSNPDEQEVLQWKGYFRRRTLTAYRAMPISDRYKMSYANPTYNSQFGGVRFDATEAVQQCVADGGLGDISSGTPIPYNPGAANVAGSKRYGTGMSFHIGTVLPKNYSIGMGVIPYGMTRTQIARIFGYYFNSTSIGYTVPNPVDFSSETAETFERKFSISNADLLVKWDRPAIPGVAPADTYQFGKPSLSVPIEELPDQYEVAETLYSVQQQSDGPYMIVRQCDANGNVGQKTMDWYDPNINPWDTADRVGGIFGPTQTLYLGSVVGTSNPYSIPTNGIRQPSEFNFNGSALFYPADPAKNYPGDGYTFFRFIYMDFPVSTANAIKVAKWLKGIDVYVDQNGNIINL